MELKFRPAQASDVDDLLPLIYSSGPEAFRYVFSSTHEEQVLSFLEIVFQEGKTEWGYPQHIVAECEGHIVGVGALKTATQKWGFTRTALQAILTHYGLFDGMRVAWRGLQTERVIRPPTKGVGLIYHLAVIPAAQGRGVGRQLVSQLRKMAGERGVKKLGLDVAETNPRAQALYQELGFEVHSYHCRHLHSPFGRVVGHCYMEQSM